MGVTAVIGLFWGDEGKGKVVDALCERADVVVRCQGGANAGHTVVLGGKTHVLHLVPAGILRDHTLCMIGNGVALDLDVLGQEIDDLTAAGVKVHGRLLVSGRTHAVLPIHKRIDRIEEDMRAAGRLGTTGRGIGPCYGDKYTRFGVRVADIMGGSGLASKVGLAVAHHGLSAADSKRLTDETLEYCRKHRPMLEQLAGDVPQRLGEEIGRGKEVVLEGSQGFLLDVDYGTFPYVTSTNTGVHGLASGAGIAPSSITRVLGVVKSYVTRVGEGCLPTAMEEPYQTMVREKGREYGATTGRPRRCGWMDLVALRYSCRLNGVNSIAITKLDTLSGLDTIKVAVAYEYYGALVASFPDDVESLSACVPRYATKPAWASLDGASRISDLPAGAAEYVKLLTESAEAGLAMVSVGPSRGDLLRVGD